MRVLVYGGREFDDWVKLHNTLYNVHRWRKITCIIQGEAKGADFLARVWAKHMDIPFESYPADWRTHGRMAGPVRNQQMIDEGKPEYAIAFPGNAGTYDMTTRLQNAGVPVWEVT